ncbi:hypothetical protein BU24DRAFT_429143 [Aaosphaeria arxii CBS 175.79]|uniref:Aspartate/glutamate racemase family protein n=1 Tax=Aaosphaeria arxii CBS 175.79 TaxID=1450172 RepID=A0A6A5X7H4_9PLEO|nr:uncharacterized protein BU24DRAFT_429143 [Aaosphaeria arxii CBS 175.79]KAF2008882.1 hypothetical protein BU24DRAFT_429143 [Aaosphaeria arxii CBS 175.79]
MAQQSRSLPPLGFISLDIILHRPPGDPYNQNTWPFPLIREKARDTSESAVVTATAYDDAFLDRFVEAGKRLAARGAIGIITSCGFLAIAQSELSARLPIPIMTSALVQAPSLLATIAPRRKLGILTFDSTRLGAGHLQKLGIDPSRCHIHGAPTNGALQQHVRQGAPYLHEEISRELVAAAKEMLQDAPEISLLLLECTNMPPFSETIQSAIALPVYDIQTAALWFYSGLVNIRPTRWGPILEDDISTRT